MKSKRSIQIAAVISCVFILTILCTEANAQAAVIYLPDQEDVRDTYFYKQVEIPQGKILRAWTAMDALHEYTLYINGREASRSRYGRIPSSFRIAEEIENIAQYLKPGTNTFAVHAHIWTSGSPTFRLESEIQIETTEDITKFPIATDKTWFASHEAPENWNKSGFKPQGWIGPLDNGPGRRAPRFPKEKEHIFHPEVPAPFSDSVIKEFPDLKNMSDWRQYVYARDTNTEFERFMEIFQTEFIARRYAQFTPNANTRMGDTFSINGYPVGNGIVFTVTGSYPFLNTSCILGPEYQYPVQWNPGTTFAGDGVELWVGEKRIGLRNQWFWKIRGTDITVGFGAEPDNSISMYAITFAPPDLKALMRIYIVANNSGEPLQNVEIRNHNYRVKPEGNTLTETVIHVPIADAAGDKNTRTIITGLLEDQAVTASYNEQTKNGTITIPLGEIAPGTHAKRLLYHITFLATRNDEPVPSDADQTLSTIKQQNYKLLDETIKHWRNYNASSTTLEAPGDWGVRVTDFIDDVKMLVQAQQFKRTGAIGPMSFFSDQWIRDAVGPLKSFSRTGKLENARRILDYHYLSAIACKKILNWLPMDVGIDRELEPVEDWSQITMNHADRHAHCEVPSWVVIKHYWYFKFSGDTETINEHWEYLKRCYYGQFDNAFDKIFRPDFKIPFHGDETYIYSGGEALWGGRYDLQQNSYPGGNIYSADSTFELVAAGDALIEMGKAIGKDEDVAAISEINPKIREATEKYYWMPDLGFYAQGMSTLFEGQLNRYPMGNIMANVVWSGYRDGKDPKAVSNTLRMMEYLMEKSGVMNPILGYDVTVGMLQGQCLYSIAAINHPWAEKAFYALLMIAGATTEFSEWMAPGEDFRTMYRANRIRPWEAGINLDALLYYLSGFEPDAFNNSMTLTPRLPTGVYSPIKWDHMTLKNLPMGKGMFDLRIEDTGDEKSRTRTYTLTSKSPDEVTVNLNALIPFGNIRKVKANNRAVKSKLSKVFSQALVETSVMLPAGKTMKVTVDYRPEKTEPVALDIKPFIAPQPKFDKSDIVVFTQLRPKPNDPNYKLLREELGAEYKVLALDASLPTDAETFEAAILTRSGIKTKMLIISEGTMAGQRKNTFWWNPKFDDVIGKFINRGGIVIEASSRNSSSKWLQNTLGSATYKVNYSRGGNVLALDKKDEALDKNFYWLDEKSAQACGKWSGYWAGTYEMPYAGDNAIIRDGALIWGTQEQPHGCMQYTMNTNPGKDHLIRIRSWPRPKKGFTLQVTEDSGKTWEVIETVWVPVPEDPKVNGWIDVYMTLPAKYVTKEQTIFRVGQPDGSSGGIGHASYKSTGASRIWIRDNTEKPPTVTDIKTSSPFAEKLGLPAAGIIGVASGRIEFKGFTAPYRLLGDSGNAALIFKKIGKGLYIKSELTSRFPMENMLNFIDTLMGPSFLKGY